VPYGRPQPDHPFVHRLSRPAFNPCQQPRFRGAINQRDNGPAAPLADADLLSGEASSETVRLSVPGSIPSLASPAPSPTTQLSSSSKPVRLSADAPSPSDLLGPDDGRGSLSSRDGCLQKPACQ